MELRVRAVRDGPVLVPALALGPTDPPGLRGGVPRRGDRPPAPAGQGLRPCSGQVPPARPDAASAERSVPGDLRLRGEPSHGAHGPIGGMLLRVRHHRGPGRRPHVRRDGRPRRPGGVELEGIRRRHRRGRPGRVHRRSGFGARPRRGPDGARGRHHERRGLGGERRGLRDPASRRRGSCDELPAGGGVLFPGAVHVRRRSVAVPVRLLSRQAPAGRLPDRDRGIDCGCGADDP